jgi:tetratricopeptide (TPR) repeat protein/TolB-like protein
LKRLLTTCLLLVLSVSALAASTVTSDSPNAPKTIIVLPFENESKAPGIEWIGEAFPEVMGERFSTSGLYVISREDRIHAFDRASIPANLRPSRATLFRIAEQLDVDYMVLGSYTFDGQKFTATAQLLDVKALHLSPEQKESSPLVNILDVQSALTWDLLRIVDPDFGIPRNDFVADSPAVRLDAFENYVRGVVATTRQEKIAKFREAIRLNPAYSRAILQLGRTYFDGREYESAASWFTRVPKTDLRAGEANFYAGLSYYYMGDFPRADEAFNFVATRLPLTEVYNNLGVVESRRGKRTAVEHFQKAAEADPNDSDYHFNLAVSLYRTGDTGGAVRQLKEAIRLNPSDSEAQSLLDVLNLPHIGNAMQATGQVRVPLERIKRNYDETSFRQLALEIRRTTELRLSKLAPKEHAAFHVEHGHELLEQGFLTEAAQEFREAITLDPTNAGAHAGLATLLEKNNDLTGARSEAQTAMKLQPSPEALVVLARLDLRDNNLNAAAQHLDHALALEPGNSAAQELKRTIPAKASEKPQASVQP